ncbi:TSUP family transporter, partial [Sphaerotilus sp.]|uniref:TSUP family transporter n=1 Tax=Sphaerotilus sp. TaxID=2093942 RepID=UPI0034E2472F
AGAPPISFYVMPLKLEPLRFSGTMAVFFTLVNLSKWIPYWQLGLIDLTNLGTSLALGPVVLVGVWAGVRLATRVKPTLFYRLVMAGMLLSGVKLLWDAVVA